MIFCDSTDQFCFIISLIYQLLTVLKLFLIISLEREHNHALGEKKTKLKEIGHEQALYSEKMSDDYFYRNTMAAFIKFPLLVCFHFSEISADQN